MAVAVARALEEERHLVVESGHRRVGKSAARPLTAVPVRAPGRKRKAIISTHTITFGRLQLLYKDIPILAKSSPRDASRQRRH